MSQIDSQSRPADHMAGECFEQVWLKLLKTSFPNPDGDREIDEVVDAEMESKTTKKEKPAKATGNTTMDRMIARAKGIKQPRKESGRKPANLPTETLRRLHAKVKKD